MSQIVPSQMTKLIYKQKVKAATKGWDLLKKKNDTLKKKMQEVMIKLIEKKKMVKDLFLKSFLSIAESEWSAGDFYLQIMNQVEKASFSLDISFHNIAGVKIPTFIAREDDSFTMNKVSITQGAVQIEKARNTFKELLEVVVQIASLQTSFIKLHKVISVTSRRVNALEFIVIPRFKDTVRYIEQELEELAREEKFTMKKVLDNRRKAMEEAERVLNEKKEKMGIDSDDEEEVENILDENNDDDILF